MVRTRRQRRRPGSSTRRSYRRRVRSSKCRGAGPAVCRSRVAANTLRAESATFVAKPVIRAAAVAAAAADAL